MNFNTIAMIISALPSLISIVKELLKREVLGTKDDKNATGSKLGTIVDMKFKDKSNPLKISNEDLNRHVFICGTTGSGKTTTVFNIIKNVNVPFLVIDPEDKREYRNLFGEEAFQNKNLNIFTLGGKDSPISINPFYFQRGVDINTHINTISSILVMAFATEAAIPEMIRKIISLAYINKGWILSESRHPFLSESEYLSKEGNFYFPTMQDLLESLDEAALSLRKGEGISEMEVSYIGAIKARLESLCSGQFGNTFNTYNCLPIETILRENTIIELADIGHDTDVKALAIGIILMFIREYIGVDRNKSEGLKNLLVLEEAHILLESHSTDKQSSQGNSRGKTLEFLCSMLTTCRGLGMGVVVAEQSPTRLDSNVIKNTNTIIAHKVNESNDSSCIVSHLGITDAKDREAICKLLTDLPPGVALCKKPSNSEEFKPVLCKIEKVGISDSRVNIADLMDKKAVRYAYSMKLDTFSNEFLKENERELFIDRIIYTLCVCEEFNFEHYVSVAKENLHRLLDNKTLYNDDVTLCEYIAYLFCRKLSKCCKLPLGFFAFVQQTYLHPNREGYRKMNESFSYALNCDLKTFVITQLCNIVIISNNMTTEDEVATTVANLLFPIGKETERMPQEIYERL